MQRQNFECVQHAVQYSWAKDGVPQSRVIQTWFSCLPKFLTSAASVNIASSVSATSFKPGISVSFVDEGYILVADSGYAYECRVPVRAALQVVQFSPLADGLCLERTIGFEGTAPGQFLCPLCATLIKSTLYVLDRDG
jgi:hypothetical protein